MCPEVAHFLLLAKKECSIGTLSREAGKCSQGGPGPRLKQVGMTNQGHSFEHALSAAANVEFAPKVRTGNAVRDHQPRQSERVKGPLVQKAQRFTLATLR
jgi:hypothetical protein